MYPLRFIESPEFTHVTCMIAATLKNIFACDKIDVAKKDRSE